jgi:hypothetical protein
MAEPYRDDAGVIGRLLMRVYEIHERVIREADDLQLYGSSDPLSNPLCSHDNSGMRIGPRNLR